MHTDRKTNTAWKSTAHKQMFCLSPRIHAHILRGWLTEGPNLLICVRKITDNPGRGMHLRWHLVFSVFFVGLNKDNHSGVDLVHGRAHLRKAIHYSIGAEGWDAYLSNGNRKLKSRGLISEHLTVGHSACLSRNSSFFLTSRQISTNRPPSLAFASHWALLTSILLMHLMFKIWVATGTVRPQPALQ